MNTTMIRRWSSGLGVKFATILLATSAWAQAPASHSVADAGSNSEMASAAQPVPTPTTTSHHEGFVIGNGDMLAISVWKQPDISRTVPVRSDGRISLPLIGDIQATGLTPEKLQGEITTKLQPFLAEPEVTVIVEQINSQKFNILGRVAKPGAYPLTNSTTVLDAIALAGGCRDFAKHKSIYILRVNPDGSESRLPFNYQDVIKGKNLAQNVKLLPHDTIVIP
jgi:polysaccharide export outer membrane protein